MIAVVKVSILILGALPGKDHRVGVERLAIVEGDVLAQMEGVLGVVPRHLPALCQRGHDLSIFIKPNQRIVQVPCSRGLPSCNLWQVEGVGEDGECPDQRALRSRGGRNGHYLDLLHDGLFDLDGLYDFLNLLDHDPLDDDLWFAGGSAGGQGQPGEQDHERNELELFWKHGVTLLSAWSGPASAWQRPGSATGPGSHIPS